MYFISEISSQYPCWNSFGFVFYLWCIGYFILISKQELELKIFRFVPFKLLIDFVCGFDELIVCGKNREVLYILFHPHPRDIFVLAEFSRILDHHLE